METVRIAFTINGRKRAAQVSPRLLLSDFIRHELRLVGTHVGCEHGVCGACTINLDGQPARSCLMFAAQIDGAHLTTLEGLSKPGAIGAIQEAFWEEHGLQCGFCTPGMLMIADDLLRRTPDPTDEEIREAVSANLCRCTGYEFIINAIRSAGAKLRLEKEETAVSHHMEAAQ
jgi:aerobic-type carbon monoxide dehydrogenase small subunit (CoxS/CutS family)